MAAGDGFVTETELGELLLRVYSHDAIQKLQNFESPLLSRLKNSPSYSVGGEGFRFGVDVRGGESFRFQRNQDQLPTAGNETILQAEVDPRFIVGTVQVGGLAKALSPGQPASFADVVGYTVDRRTTEMTQYMEGALFGDNRDILAEVASASGTTVTLDSGTDAIGGVWRFREGMAITAVVTSDGDDVGSTNVTVEDVDWAAGTIVTSADISGSITTSHCFVLQGSQQTAVDNAWDEVGFDGLYSGVSDSGTYLGIDRSANPRWESNVIDAASTPIDEDILQRAQIRAMQEGGINRSAVSNFTIITHYNQCRKFAEIAYPRQRFSGTSVDLGVSKLTYNDKELMESPFCPHRDVYCGDLSTFNKFVTKNGDLQISQDFGPAWRFVADYDQGMAYMRAYINYVVRNPRRWVRIKNLTDVANR